jgi:deoxyribonuclease-4
MHMQKTTPVKKTEEKTAGLIFGTAGIPNSSAGSDIVSGIERIAELGLGALELEFVRGVSMSEELASRVRTTAEKHKVVLTAHGPYWINLNAKEKRKLTNSHAYIFQTAQAAHLAGAVSITFHAGSLMGDPPEKAFAKVAQELRKIVDKIRAAGITLDIRPELSGKRAQVGSLEEILKMSSSIEGVRPCIDFSHNHARTGGMNSYENFAAVCSRVSRKIGKAELKRMHIHVSGIEFGLKGEKKHLDLGVSDMKYRDLLKALKDNNCAGIVICESPNLEDDAVLLQKTYAEV